VPTNVGVPGNVVRRSPRPRPPVQAPAVEQPDLQGPVVDGDAAPSQPSLFDELFARMMTPSPSQGPSSAFERLAVPSSAPAAAYSFYEAASLGPAPGVAEGIAPPQRVTVPPGYNGAEPSAEAAASLFEHLAAVLQTPDDAGAAGSGSARRLQESLETMAAAKPAAPKATPKATTPKATPQKAAPKNARPASARSLESAKVAADAAAAKNVQPPQNVASNAPRGLLTLSGPDGMTLGVDCARGGTISWLSARNLPYPWTGRNLLNSYDAGRHLQQSYYGCDDGTCWYNRPWRYNPVQGGSWQNLAPKVLEGRLAPAPNGMPGSVIRTRVQPRNWGGQELLQDVVMESTIDVSATHQIALVRFKLIYNGSVAHPVRVQEMPAVFAARGLGVLATYEGGAPWTGGKMRFSLPGAVNTQYKATEGWAAWADATTGYGLGVYSPAAAALTAYRIGPDGSGASADTSYFSLTRRFALTPGTEYSYESYIALGRVDSVRDMFSWQAVKAARARTPAFSFQRARSANRG
jgi:hypothetical protein